MADFNSSLSQLRKDALLGGGDVRIQKQHQKGKGTARERISCPARCWFIPGDRNIRYPDPGT